MYENRSNWVWSQVKLQYTIQSIGESIDDLVILDYEECILGAKHCSKTNKKPVWVFLKDGYVKCTIMLLGIYPLI